MPYVMGDDPERMDAGAIIAARAVRRAVIRNDEPVAGYLYLVCHKPVLPQGRLEVLGSSIAKPALVAIMRRRRAGHAAGGLDHRHGDAAAAPADAGGGIDLPRRARRRRARRARRPCCRHAAATSSAS